MPKNNKLKQGWGLAYKQLDSGEHRLYATDGSSNIYVIDPVAWDTLSTIAVKTQGGMPINSLNELEIIKTSSVTKNYIFANQFTKNIIWMIDLRTGVAVAQWNMKELLDKQMEHIRKIGRSYDSANAVLNGIAYYQSNDSFLISGKLWDFIYEIKFDYHIYMK